MVTSIVVWLAHWLAFGVKVYVNDCVLSTTDGDQVPLIPFNDSSGKVGDGAPLQIGAGAINIGTTKLFTLIVTVNGEAHIPLLGVNV